jgi:two-component system, response regulator
MCNMYHIPVTNGAILLVEDDANFAELTLAFLLKGEAAPHEVALARDGFEAIDYLFDRERNPSEMPSLVLLDLNMPRMDGFGVLRKMRASERTRFVPVVMLTSSVHSEDVRMAYSLGANGYLDKLCGRAPWGEMVQTVARYWLEMNVTPQPLPLGARGNGLVRRT